MSSTRLLSSPRDPAAVAVGLLIVLAIIELAFNLGVLPDFMLVLISFQFLPLAVGSAVLATLCVARARSRREAWLFVGADVVAVASTAWICLRLASMKDRIGILDELNVLFSFQLILFTALLVYTFIVIAFADVASAKNRQTEEPRIILLTALSIASVAALMALGWWFGYIRA